MLSKKDIFVTFKVNQDDSPLTKFNRVGSSIKSVTLCHVHVEKYLAVKQFFGSNFTFSTLSFLHSIINNDPCFSGFVVVTFASEVLNFLNFNPINTVEKAEPASHILLAFCKESGVLKVHWKAIFDLLLRQLTETQFKVYNLSENNSKKESTPERKVIETRVFFNVLAAITFLINNKINLEEEFVFQATEEVLNVLTTVIERNDITRVKNMDSVTIETSKYSKLIKSIEKHVILSCCSFAKAILTNLSSTEAFEYTVSFVIENIENLLIMALSCDTLIVKEIILLLHELIKFVFQSPMDSLHSNVNQLIEDTKMFLENVSTSDAHPSLKNFYFLLRTREMTDYIAGKIEAFQRN